MQSKTFWIINQYASTPNTGMGGRNYYIAKYLAKMGHKVYLIASGYTHLLREPPYLKDEFTINKLEKNLNFVWVKMPRYNHAHDKRRILNWFLFVWKILKLPKKIKKKPDIILISSPSIFSFLGAHRLAKKFNSKLVFEVRDIWPLTLVELGGYSKFHPFIFLMQFIEDRAYRYSDFVFSNLPYAVDHMVERGMNRKKFSWIPNGIDVNELENPIPLDKKIESKIPYSKFIVGYSGTMGIANALYTLIDAAKILKDNNDIAFVMVGDGSEKRKLQEISKNLENVYILDPIQKQQIQNLLLRFDLCFIGSTHLPIYRFGTAPNKIPEYMYSSKPILQSCNDAFDYISEADCGITVSSMDSSAIAEAILYFKNLSSQDLRRMGANAKSYVLANHDYSKLALKISAVLSE